MSNFYQNDINTFNYSFKPDFYTKNPKSIINSSIAKDNNINGPLRDLRQAYEKQRNEKDPRKFAQWKKDIDKRSSAKDQRDLIKVLKKTRDNLEEGGDGLL